MYEKDRLRLYLSMYGTVPNDAGYDPQPDGIRNLGLKKHQLQSIRAMNALETNQIRMDTGELLVAEIGVLSNKIGSGKSLCVLGLIVSRVRLSTQPFVTFHFGDAAYVMNERTHIDIVGGNLIVVPNHLVPMWDSYIRDYTTLDTLIVKKDMFPLDWTRVSEHDVVLCGASHYNLLIKSCPWTWSRVVFDESDSINIPACVKPSARFVWFVSSSLNNLLFCDGSFWKYEPEGLTRMTTNGISKNGYIKNTFKRLESVNANCILSKIIVKMNDQYIDEHLNLPPVLHHSVVCDDPVELVVLDNAISDHVRMILNGNDSCGALDYMGCPVGSKDNIISFVCKNLSVQIKNYVKKIEYLNHIETIDSESLETNRLKITKTQTKITELEKRLERIHTKIEEFSANVSSITNCPICLDDENDTCLFMCCMNQFCKPCVDRLLQAYTQDPLCPLCRGAFRTMILRKVTNEPSHNKYTETLRVIKDLKHDSSVIVFMWTENTLRKLQRELDNKGILYRILGGNGQTIHRIIKWFDEKRVRVLLINASVYGCGLDLSSATDVILFQKMHADHENQLTGRAHRIGRTHELNVHRILHKNEIKN
jgi:hypothetical protein